MKLTRLLLRYEPAGVGLEIEDDRGEKSVRHKDLPADDSVTSVADIQALVDKLLLEESDILTRRKHHSPLKLLLARLYQIDLGAQEEEEASSPSGTRADASNATGPQVNQQVILVRLKGKLQQHNGEIGVVTKARQEKEKYEVALPAKANDPSAGVSVSVKGNDHLLVVSKNPALNVGTCVVIRSLRNHMELNGSVGVVAECLEQANGTMRYEVRATDTSQLFRVKQDNLTAIDAPPGGPLAPAGVSSVVQSAKENREPNTSGPPAATSPRAGAAHQERPKVSARSHGGPDEGLAGNAAGPDEAELYEPGSTVQIHSLKAAVHFNGRRAEVLSVDRARGRYEIRLDDGSIKTVRAENALLVSRAPGASPRRNP